MPAEQPCDNGHGDRAPSARQTRAHDKPVPQRLSLTLGVEGSGEGDPHGCRLGSDGRGDLARYGRPAGAPSLTRRRGRALGAAKYEAIPFVGPLLRRPAVRRGAIRER